jgi:hypothetical protein
MPKRFHDSCIWEQDWFLEMPTEYRLLWIWIKDKCDHAGIWKPNKKTFEVINGVSVDLNVALNYFNQDKERILVTSKENWLMIDFFVFQYGTVFNTANRLHNSIYKIYNQQVINLTSIRGLLEVKLSSNRPQFDHLDTLKDKDKDKVLNGSILTVTELSDNNGEEKKFGAGHPYKLNIEFREWVDSSTYSEDFKKQWVRYLDYMVLNSKAYMDNQSQEHKMKELWSYAKTEAEALQIINQTISDNNKSFYELKKNKSKKDIPAIPMFDPPNKS